MPELLGKPHNNPPWKGALIPWWDSDRKCGGGFPSQDRCVPGKETGLPKPTGARKTQEGLNRQSREDTR